MTTSISKEHWAESKVRTFAPVTKEKSTLLAIAGHANPQGYGSIVSYDKLMRETGHSTRTIRRHVKALVERGELVCWCDLDRQGRSNAFFIPIAAETIEELEARTGISRKQLKLPLVQRDRAGAAYVPDGLKCPSPEVDLAGGVGQSVPETLSQHVINKGERNFSLKTKKERMMEQQKLREHQALKSAPISPETQRLIAEQLARMQATSDMAPTLGTSLKRAVWGDTSQEEIDRIRKEAMPTS